MDFTTILMHVEMVYVSQILVECRYITKNAIYNALQCKLQLIFKILCKLLINNTISAAGIQGTTRNKFDIHTKTFQIL